MFSPRFGLTDFNDYADFNQNKNKRTIYRDYKFHRKQILAAKGKIPDDLFIREKHRNVHTMEFVTHCSDPSFFNSEDDIFVNKDTLTLESEYFKDCEKLDDRLRRNLKKLGYEQLTHVQRVILPLVSSSFEYQNDVILCGRTGSGKTLGYLIATINNAIISCKALAISQDTDIQRNVRIVIMVQSNHAAEQVYIWAKQLTLKTSVIVGSAIGAFNRTDELEKLDTYGADILIATIGRLTDYLKSYPNLIKGVRQLIFDDAELFMRDENWDKGIKVFRDGIEATYQIVCLSAGFDERSFISFSRFTDDNYWFIDIASLNQVEKKIPQQIIDLLLRDRTEELTKLLMERAVDNRYPKAIVFCNSQEVATLVSQRLRLDHTFPKDFRPRVAYLHGGTYDAQSIFNAFCTDKGQRTDLLGDDSIEIDVIVACDGFAYGINAKIELVINFDFPTSLCIYAQRIGRVGRQGVQKPEAITFVDSITMRKDPKIVEDNVLNVIQAAIKAKAKAPDYLEAHIKNEFDW